MLTNRLLFWIRWPRMCFPRNDHTASGARCPLVAARGVPKREQTPAFDPFGNGLEAESNCSVCKRARMTFEPPSLYCYGCGQRIKRNQVGCCVCTRKQPQLWFCSPQEAPMCRPCHAKRCSDLHTLRQRTRPASTGMQRHAPPRIAATCRRSQHCHALPPLSLQVYYGTPASHEIKGVWCHPCYGEIKTETVPLDGFNIRKAELEKRKNDDEVRGGLLSLSELRDHYVSAHME